MKPLTNDRDAFLLALRLAVTMPENASVKVLEIIMMAEEIASRLDPEVVEECKAIVEKEVSRNKVELH